jgi:hypothetical protein
LKEKTETLTNWYTEEAMLNVWYTGHRVFACFVWFSKKENRLFSKLLSFWTLSIVRYSKKREDTTFLKLDLFPSSGEWERTPSQLGPL